VTKGSGRAKFMWGKEKQQAFDDLRHFLCSTQVPSFPDLKELFMIETNAFDYVVGAILTYTGHLVAYHSDKLSDIV
jgi:hypothetical protein